MTPDTAAIIERWRQHEFWHGVQVATTTVSLVFIALTAAAVYLEWIALKP